MFLSTCDFLCTIFSVLVNEKMKKQNKFSTTKTSGHRIAAVSGDEMGREEDTQIRGYLSSPFLRWLFSDICVCSEKSPFVHGLYNHKLKNQLFFCVQPQTPLCVPLTESEKSYGSSVNH